MEKEPNIVIADSHLLVGMKMDVTLKDNLTFELWQGFMSRRKEVEHRSDENLYSVQIYNSIENIHNFTPDTTFEKWAAVKVASLEDIPIGLESLTMKGGLYAHYTYTGLAEKYFETLEYILQQWIPQSGYRFDVNRPQYEIMGKNYKPRSEDSEEEVWIPVEILV